MSADRSKNEAHPDSPAGPALGPALARRRRLPWSERAILAASLVGVVLLAPLWLDPVTLSEVAGRGASPPATPTVAPSPSPVGVHPAPARPAVQVSVLFASDRGEGAP